MLEISPSTVAKRDGYSNDAISPPGPYQSNYLGRISQEPNPYDPNTGYWDINLTTKTRLPVVYPSSSTAHELGWVCFELLLYYELGWVCFELLLYYITRRPHHQTDVDVGKVRCR